MHYNYEKYSPTCKTLLPQHTYLSLPLRFDGLTNCSVISLFVTSAIPSTILISGGSDGGGGGIGTTNCKWTNHNYYIA